jgi:hypothetical protein
MVGGGAVYTRSSPPKISLSKYVVVVVVMRGLNFRMCCLAQSIAFGRDPRDGDATCLLTAAHSPAAMTKSTSA